MCQDDSHQGIEGTSPKTRIALIATACTMAFAFPHVRAASTMSCPAQTMRSTETTESRQKITQSAHTLA
ncbi:hypothetical protein D3C83_302130 [compost metagenome]